MDKADDTNKINKQTSPSAISAEASKDAGVIFVPATSPSTTNFSDGTPKIAPSDENDLPPTVFNVETQNVNKDNLVKGAGGDVTKNAPTEIIVPVKTDKPEIKTGTSSVPSVTPTLPALSAPTASSSPLGKLRSVRTFQGDVAESIKTNKTSVVKVVLAEQVRRQKLADLASPKSRKNIAFIAVSLALLIIGGTTAFIFYNKSKQPTIKEIAVKIPSLIFAENTKPISVTGLSAELLSQTIGDEVNGANNKLDTIENIFLYEGPKENAIPLSTHRLFFFLDNRMPPTLLRSLDNNFMLGVHTFNGNHPFIILQTNYYENTFAGILAWEQYMARDLLPIFGIKKNPDSPIFLRTFEDKIIKNRDTRALKDDNGDVLLFYVFKDKKTLIITNSEFTMDEVMRRLNSSNPVIR